MLEKLFCLVFLASLVTVVESSAFYRHSYGRTESTVQQNTSLIRQKRDDDECSINEFQCDDGFCVRVNSDCNGVYDCSDGSDEAFVLCRQRTCFKLQFRCNYGACIEMSRVCDKVRDCVDGSDELLHRCNGGPLIVGEHFTCRNGQSIPKAGRCDGIVDCADGYDESVAACAEFTCQPGQFQCEYGGCVDGSAKCNGTAECRDGSDEQLGLCGKLAYVKASDLTSTTTEPPVSSNKCILPRQPENGVYKVISETNSSDADYVYLKYECYSRFKLVGESKILCWRGVWPVKMPCCVQTCPLAKHPSIEYHCTEEGTERPRECNDEEIDGTIIKPLCKQPNYYSPVELPYMQCNQGSWSSGPICAAECGTLTVKLTPLVLGGETANFGDVPWHVGIYNKNSTTGVHEQICGGSLISNSVILTAAHCFWNEHKKKIEDESNYAVAVGKFYREWYNPKDEPYAQKSNISKIVVPKLFRGIELDYHHDIAVVIVSKPFIYKWYVRPVCLDFNEDFNNDQLKSGKFGKAAGWGLTTEYRWSQSQELKVIDLPYEDEERCLNVTSRPLLQYVVYDKICAGTLEGEALCRGDSGGGLAFPSEISGVERYYLRGIASTTPLLRNDISCNVNSLTSFTSVIKYKEFIKRYWYP